MTLSVSGDSITFPDLSTQLTAPSGFGFKNRIINGDMRIDQRNAGASVTPNLLSFPADRTFGFGSVTGKFSCQQNSGGVTPPTGFSNYIGAVSLSAYSVGSGEQYIFGQPIEGLNVSDLAWGTASAQAATLSFWVRSSLTGTFGGSLQNSAFNRSYPFAYTVSAANTWEYKTITIAGDTAGTWLATNGVGIRLSFSLGAGSTMSGTAGAWSGSNFVSATGATSVVGTSGATVYITGVQLEKGSTATAFDYRDYGRELIMCQRYYERTYPIQYPFISATYINGTNESYHHWYFKVEKRATPTWVFVGAWAVAPTSIWTSTSEVLLGNASSYFYGNSSSYGTASAEL
jgi:hypothetical protein